MQVRVTPCLSIVLATAMGVAGPRFAVADTAPGDAAAKQPVAGPSNPDAAKSNPDAAKKPAEKAPAPDTPAVVVDDTNVESLLGKDVVSASGEKLGQITDILVSHSGEIRAAVIDFGGFLGVGSRKIAVAWPTLQFSKSGITLSMTRDELRVTPEYHQGEPVVIVGAAAVAAPSAPSATTESAPPASAK
jgi:PRC-barrel domain protein